MTKHAKNKQLKQIENQSQSGRSMVEMLGVLAIIAVLSIGGIIMFRYAMNYYQADQIAHEMNIMRNDAQIKIAQGTEKLTLGEPYDSINESTLGHIQFNDDYPIDFACALADDETVELSNISCHVANAYYIELQNIPEGVCKPLAELLNGMSNVIAFNVNKNEYPDKGNCEAGNENVLNAVFSAEAVSELKVCTEDTDCESENAPYCDLSRHVCVRCYEDSQCAHNQYCEDNICKSCDEGLVWNGTDCVECTEDNDCTDTPDTPACYTEEYKCVECLTYEHCTGKDETPQCDEESHTCKSCVDIDERTPVWGGTQCVECVNSTDCADELVCKENTCGPCEKEEECQEKGENYHCSKDKTCIQCLDNQVWGGQEKGCVECTEDNDCADTPDTPKCNTTANKCVECLTDSDCKNPTPICSDENTCVACKTSEECRLKNPSAENCTKNGACCVAEGMIWTNGECACPENYDVSETTQKGKKICLPYCKEEEESGLIILIDHSGSLGNIIDSSGKLAEKYPSAVQKLKSAVQKLQIPENIKSAVYLAGCHDNENKECGSVRGPKYPILTYGIHSVFEIQNALDFDTSVNMAAGYTSSLGEAIREDIVPLCKTGKEKFIVIVYWDNDDKAVNNGLNQLVAACSNTQIYSVALNGKEYTGSGLVKDFNLNNIDDLNSGINEALNNAIQQESCVQRKKTGG